MLELAESDPEELEEAPKEAPTRRLDEARAARQLKARW
jgi:glycine dehydrogenase subunit 2